MNLSISPDETDLKVLLLLYRLDKGGTEHVMSELSNNLPDFFDTELVLINGDLRCYSLKYKPLELGFECKSFKLKQIYAILTLIPVIIKYTKILAKEHPNVSVSMLDYDNLVNVLACKLTNTTAITGVRQSLVTQDIPFFARKLRWLTSVLSKKYAQKVITNSYGSKNELITLYGADSEKIDVIYNPKNIDEILALSEEPVDEEIFSQDIPIIITVGRLFEVKGQWHLLRIFANIRKQMPCKLVICGDGPLNEYLNNLANELGISDDVTFLGFCRNPYKYVAKSTVFAFTSLYEGQPNALIEAMICGCPVVSTDCEHGPREILEDGKYGLLSEKLDSKHYSAEDPLTHAETDMLNKLVLLLNDSELRTKYSNLEKSRINIFDSNQIIKEYAESIVSSLDHN